MKSVKASLGASLDRPNPSIRFYLFHGPDEAGSRALALRLLKGLGNAERFVVVGSAVRADPASLADEAGAIAMFGGARAIWIEPAGEEIAEGATALLGLANSESAVIAIAGALKRSSALLKLTEAHPLALAHCSYVPEARDLERLVHELARPLGLSMSPDVAQRIVRAASSNQAIIASELEKFALFLDAGPDRARNLDSETLDLLSADSAESESHRLGDLALSGQLRPLLDELSRMSGTNGDLVPAVRAIQRRLLMLAPLRARVEAGESVSGVTTSLGKALFWKDKPIVERMLKGWSCGRLAHVAGRISKLERELMLSRAPAQASLGEVLIGVARSARPG